MSTTRFPNGLTNSKNKTCSDMPLLDPSLSHTYFNDFDSMAGFNNTTDTNSWDIDVVQAGAGDASIALTDLDGGAILITNDDANNDRVFVYKKGESFKFESGKELWFKARYKVSSATDEDSIVGLVITGTDPIGTIPTDGVWFQQTDTSANLVLRVVKNSTATDTTVTTLTADTFVTVGFYYNGKDQIQYFVNDVRLGVVTTLTNLPDDELLTVMFGCQNGSAAARTMTVDFILANKSPR